MRPQSLPKCPLTPQHQLGYPCTPQFETHSHCSTYVPVLQPSRSNCVCLNSLLWVYFLRQSPSYPNSSYLLLKVTSILQNFSSTVSSCCGVFFSFHQMKLPRSVLLLAHPCCLEHILNKLFMYIPPLECEIFIKSQPAQCS